MGSAFSYFLSSKTTSKTIQKDTETLKTNEIEKTNIEEQHAQSYNDIIKNELEKLDELKKQTINETLKLNETITTFNVDDINNIFKTYQSDIQNTWKNITDENTRLIYSTKLETELPKLSDDYNYNDLYRDFIVLCKDETIKQTLDDNINKLNEILEKTFELVYDVQASKFNTIKEMIDKNTYYKQTSEIITDVQDVELVNEYNEYIETINNILSELEAETDECEGLGLSDDVYENINIITKVFNMNYDIIDDVVTVKTTLNKFGLLYHKMLQDIRGQDYVNEINESLINTLNVCANYETIITNIYDELINNKNELNEITDDYLIKYNNELTDTFIPKYNVFIEMLTTIKEEINTTDDVLSTYVKIEELDYEERFDELMNIVDNLKTLLSLSINNETISSETLINIYDTNVEIYKNNVNTYVETIKNINNETDAYIKVYDNEDLKLLSTHIDSLINTLLNINEEINNIRLNVTMSDNGYFDYFTDSINKYDDEGDNKIKIAIFENIKLIYNNIETSYSRVNSLYDKFINTLPTLSKTISNTKSELLEQTNLKEYETSVLFIITKTNDISKKLTDYEHKLNFIQYVMTKTNEQTVNVDDCLTLLKTYQNVINEVNEDVNNKVDIDIINVLIDEIDMENLAFEFDEVGLLFNERLPTYVDTSILQEIKTDIFKTLNEQKASFDELTTSYNIPTLYDWTDIQEFVQPSTLKEYTNLYNKLDEAKNNLKGLYDNIVTVFDDYYSDIKSKTESLSDDDDSFLQMININFELYDNSFINQIPKYKDCYKEILTYTEQLNNLYNSSLDDALTNKNNIIKYTNAGQIVVMLYGHYKYGRYNETLTLETIIEDVRKLLSVDVFETLCSFSPLLPLIWPTGTNESEININANINTHVNEQTTNTIDYVNLYNETIKPNLNTYLDTVLPTYIANAVFYSMGTIESESVLKLEDDFEGEDNETIYTYLLDNAFKTSKTNQEFSNLCFKYFTDFNVWKVLTYLSKKSFNDKVLVVPSNYPRTNTKTELFESIIIILNDLFYKYGAIETTDGTLLTYTEKNKIGTSNVINGGCCVDYNMDMYNNIRYPRECFDVNDFVYLKNCKNTNNMCQIIPYFKTEKIFKNNVEYVKFVNPTFYFSKAYKLNNTMSDIGYLRPLSILNFYGLSYNGDEITNSSSVASFINILYNELLNRYPTLTVNDMLKTSLYYINEINDFIFYTLMDKIGRWSIIIPFVDAPDYPPYQTSKLNSFFVKQFNDYIYSPFDEL